MRGPLWRKISKVVQVTASDPDEARRQTLLNILVLMVAAASLAAFLFALWMSWAGEHAEKLQCLGFWGMVLCGGVYTINRYVSGAFAALVFCAFLFGLSVIADTPEQLTVGRTTLIMVIPIAVSSILLRPAASFVVAVAASGLIGAAAYLLDLPPNIPAMVVYFLMATIIWLATRTLEKTIGSLRQANTLLLEGEERYRQLSQEHLLSLEALKASEERYRFLAENMADVIWLLDLDRMEFTYVSPSVERLRGYTPDEVLAQPWEQVLVPESLAKFQALIPERIAAYLAGDQGAASQVDEVAQPCRDGRIVWTEVVSTVFGDAETGLYVLGVSRDISDRHLLDQKRRAAEDAARQRTGQLTMINEIVKQVAAVLDMDTVLARAAQLIHEKFNYHHVGIFLWDENQEALIMRTRAGSFDKLFPPEHRIQLGKGMVGWVGQHGKTLLAGDVTVEERYLNFYPDRLPTRSELDVPIRSGDALLGVLDVQSPAVDAFNADDVLVIETLADEIAVAIQNARLYDSLLQELIERKRAEASVRKLTDELEQRVTERTAQLEASNRELEAFAYSVSHDLRAPLRAIHGFSSMLADDYAAVLDSHGLSLLRRVQDAAQRMGALIDDLLKLSRLMRSQIQLVEVDVSKLAGEIAATLTQQAPERNITWSIAGGLKAYADAGLLRIVLENLLGNAWKFTGYNAHAHIEVGCLMQESRTVFFVRDNGIGFDMAYVDKLFGPFQRLHLPEEFPGTGIGLATVQRIVQRHGGRVWAEAAVAQGATFYFTLGGV
ncbi:MAG: PAS domain-containing sensor histidine kinase [Chloroflexota bacterium]